MTDASLTRGRPSTVSAFSATCLYALAFAGCAFATYVAHDWVRSYPSLPRFETMPDPVEFFWRPRTAVFGALCFYYPLRMWLRREETDLGFLVTFPYMLSYVLPRTVRWLHLLCASNRGDEEPRRCAGDSRGHRLDCSQCARDAREGLSPRRGVWSQRLGAELPLRRADLSTRPTLRSRLFTSSTTLPPSAEHHCLSSRTSSRRSPVSHLLTKDCGCPRRSASSTWVTPAPSRISRSRASSARRSLECADLDISTAPC